MFKSARLKVKWANENISHVQKWIEEFIASKPYTLKIERSVDAFTTRVWIVGRRFTPPELPMVVGLIAQNLRSSLDHAVSEIVSRIDKADHRTGFPVHEEWKGLKESTSVRAIKRASPKLAKVILDEINPTKAGNYPLWGLNRLSNTDKHRALLILDQINGFSGGPFRAPGIEVTAARMLAPVGGYNDNGFFEFALLDEDGKVEPIIEIRIGERDAFPEAELLPTLTNCSHVVAETLNAMERASG